MTSITPTPPGTSASSASVERREPKKPDPSPPPLDTIDSAAAAEWTPPSCLARCCTYVKHRIADFFDWVCSLFCSSKPVTKEQLDAADREIDALINGLNVHKWIPKRYVGVKVSSKDDAYPYLADHIECLERTWKIRSITDRWEQGVITERQLRADRRQLIELVTSLAIFAHSDLPKKATPAMMDKVKAYSLGKLKVIDKGKVVSLFDVRTMPEMSPELTTHFTKIANEIRSAGLDKFDRQARDELGKGIAERYEKVALADLDDKRQAVRVLADCIAVREIYRSLLAAKGDVSEESITERIESLKKRLAQPVLGEATEEMYKKVEEFDFDETDITSDIGLEQSKSVIKARLNEVIDAVQSSPGESKGQ